MAQPWTPADTAAYDQLLSAAGRDLDSLVSELREQAARHGEMQGLANVTTRLMREERPALLGMLAVAMQRLSAAGPGNTEQETD